VAAVRQEIAQVLGSEAAFAGIKDLKAAEVATAQHWLQASNPSERWKWDAMFQDLPPIKFADSISTKPAPEIIPLKQVE
jgi:hypothetical protein